MKSKNALVSDITLLEPGRRYAVDTSPKNDIALPKGFIFPYAEFVVGNRTVNLTNYAEVPA